MSSQNYGYMWQGARLYELRTTLFKRKDKNIADDFLNSDSSKFENVIVCENLNHQVILTKYCTIIRTREGQKHLENIQPILKLLKEYIIKPDSTKLNSVKVEARTVDYVTDIEHVEKYFRGILVDAQIQEEYNKKRKVGKEYYEKERTTECYTSKYTTRYFIENGMCFDKNMDFSTAEYYDERIGRVRIDIGVDYSGRDSKLAKHNFEAVIEELIDKQFQLYLKSHKEEYIKTLI